MVLVHLTGERRWMRAPYRPRRDSRIFADESGGLPDDIQAEVRAAALNAIRAAGDAHADLDEETLAEMMSACVGERVGPDYVPVMLEEMGLRAQPPMPRIDSDIDVLVIGAGVSGICAAIRLTEAGVRFTVVEKNADVGGGWLENTYPDCGVDTPNHFYSYSFTPNEDWAHYYSKQPEILAYLRKTAGPIRDAIRFGVEVTELRWTGAAWQATLDDGSTLTTDAVFTGVGALNRPKFPDVENRFAGPCFHTSRWPDDLDVTGKRVALIGTGASAVQAARTTAERAKHLTIFQRSPQWIIPNPIYRAPVPDGKRRLLAEVPFYAAWYRFALFWRYADGLYPHIQVDPEWPHPDRSVSARNDKHREFLAAFVEDELRDRPDLLAKAMPHYPPYGKRMLLDNDWYRTLRRDDVSLVADAVAEITEDAVVTEDGERHPADIVVFATGFHSTRTFWPMDVIGREGRSIHDVWEGDDPRAHLGITVPGFPNLFMLLGPGTGLGHGGSAIFHIEAQVRYAVECLALMADRDIEVLEPRADVTAAYNDRLDAQHERMVFSHRGMRNWYKNADGRVVALSPWRLVDYWAMTRAPDPADFVTPSAS